MLERRNQFDFNNLFTFEMANNHAGSVAHGKRIIEEVAKVAKEFGIRAAVKLQLRELDSFIHPDFKERQDVKHIPRFISTRLSKDEFRELVEATRGNGLMTMATPFDEASVDTLLDLGIEIIKVASCSARDWPLLEKIAEAGKPVVVSVGGLTIKEVDKVVSFFEHRGTHFALMHCVAIYPTPSEKLQINFIETLRNRYPHLTVGFSTHEPPTNTTAIALAYAKGARIFEKHVGIPTDSVKQNAYSATPEELRAWVTSFKEAVKSCGESLPARVVDEAEEKDLASLKRGVFAKTDIPAGRRIARDDIFFAMPYLGGEELTSGGWREGLVADRDYRAGESISAKIAERLPRRKDIIYPIVHAVKGLLNEAKIPLAHDFQVEVSHHYGLEKFGETGCVIIDCFNREYAKKLIIQLPSQWNPVHYHKLKDETFQVLFGTLEVEVEGKKKILYPGDTLWVPRGVWHGFGTNTGAIFEEISTAACDGSGDSYYLDKSISSRPRAARKTRLMNWGRHQFDDREEE